MQLARRRSNKEKPQHILILYHRNSRLYRCFDPPVSDSLADPGGWGCNRQYFQLFSRPNPGSATVTCMILNKGDIMD